MQADATLLSRLRSVPGLRSRIIVRSVRWRQKAPRKMNVRFTPNPPSKKSNPPQVQCCKVLRAVALAKANNWARDDAKFCDADLYSAERSLIASPQATLTPFFLDTGPPGAHSFAELVLQRSCPSHGPPARV